MLANFKKKKSWIAFLVNLQEEKKMFFKVPSSSDSSLEEALLGSQFSACHDQQVVIWDSSGICVVSHPDYWSTCAPNLSLPLLTK